jgi:hypothetical protein
MNPKCKKVAFGPRLHTQCHKVLEPNSDINNDWVKKMTQELYGYFNSTATRNSKKRVSQKLSSSDDSSFSELLEGSVQAPLKTTSRNHVIKEQKENNSTLSNKPQRKAIAPFKGKTIIHLRKGSYKSPRLNKELKAKDFLSEMIKYGLDKEMAKVHYRNSLLRFSPSNCQPTCDSFKSESSQTSNSKSITFPYQRRNRSCSPDALQELVLKTNNASLNVLQQPVRARNFVFGMQTRVNENVKVLNIISLKQKNKHCLKHNNNSVFKETNNPNHRLDKKILSKLILENNEVFTANSN